MKKSSCAKLAYLLRLSSRLSDPKLLCKFPVFSFANALHSNRITDYACLKASLMTDQSLFLSQN